MIKIGTCAREIALFLTPEWRHVSNAEIFAATGYGENAAQSALNRLLTNGFIEQIRTGPHLQRPAWHRELRLTEKGVALVAELRAAGFGTSETDS